MESFKYSFPDVMANMTNEETLKIQISEGCAGWIIGKRGARINMWRRMLKGTEIKVTDENGRRYICITDEDKFHVLSLMQPKIYKKIEFFLENPFYNEHRYKPRRTNRKDEWCEL